MKTFSVEVTFSGGNVVNMRRKDLTFGMASDYFQSALEYYKSAARWGNVSWDYVTISVVLNGTEIYYVTIDH